MRCQRCGKPISPLRQLTDREFCSQEHRRRGPLASASALREPDYDITGVYLESEARREQRSAAVSGAMLGVILLIGGGLLLAARYWMPESAEPVAGRQLVSPVEDLGSRTPVAVNKFAEWVERRLPGESPVRVKWSVKSGLAEWTDSLGGKAWDTAGGSVSPGALRLWRPTLDRVNYDLSFTGVIRKKALGFAYRATDQSYYATKLKITRPGVISGASIARLVVSGGKVIEEAELPLPVLLSAGHAYKIHVTAAGDTFATYIDGYMVDEWRDERLKKGGVGFFSDDGEAASVADVEFRERKGLLSRIFATFFYLPSGLAL
ncbi:MAG: hypothetical protein C0504_01350 [Candidatus Solibacter sp.]|nr:hypothetical protein [Candidatus Solibacter sp.]